MAQLASFDLPGLSSDKRSLNRRASREGWATRTDSHGVRLSRPRCARGGGTEYHVGLLPPTARLELSRRLGSEFGIASERNSTGLKSPSWQWFNKQPRKSREEAQRRLIVVQEVTLCYSSGYTKTAAVGQIARDHSIGPSTIWKWMSFVRGCHMDDWLPALAPRMKPKSVKSTSRRLKPTANQAELVELLNSIREDVAFLMGQMNRIEMRLGLMETEH